jgi:hypothetical protein
MTRCQHCAKLTHGEHLYVEYDSQDADKIIELATLKNWIAGYQYDNQPTEIGKLKCGDIWIHFLIKQAKKNE